MVMEKEKLMALVEAAQKGDNAAMNELFNAFYNDLYYFALKTVKDEELALDITQEAFVEIINTLGNLKEPAAFVTWAKQITYHQCTRHFRKKRDVLVDEDEDGGSIFDNVREESAEFIPDEALDKGDFKATVLAILDGLSEEQRSATMMYYFDEMSVRDIAEIQGVSENTVKSRLNYARKSIKQSVEEYEKKNNIKLHAIPFFPFFKWIFEGAFEGGLSATSVSAVAEGVATATGVTVSIAGGGVAAGVTATTAATTATVATAATTATTATTATAVTAAVGSGMTTAASVGAGVGIGAKIASIPIVAKIVAGVVAAAIVVGSTAAIIVTKNDAGDTDGNGTEAVSESTPTANVSSDKGAPSDDGSSSIEAHTHTWGEWNTEEKAFGLINIKRNKDRQCTACGKTEKPDYYNGRWNVLEQLEGEKYRLSDGYLDRYFDVAGESDDAFSISGLFAAGDFLASEDHYTQTYEPTVEVSADDYYNNLKEYFALSDDIIAKMRRERPGDTYTVNFAYEGVNLMPESVVWKGGNVYRVYYVHSTSGCSYMPVFYADIEYNLHNGKPNKIIALNTDGVADYDMSRVTDNAVSLESLVENAVSKAEALPDFYVENSAATPEEITKAHELLEAMDIFGYNLTEEEMYGKCWGWLDIEADGDTLKSITVSTDLPVYSWDGMSGNMLLAAARRDIDRFVTLVGGEDNVCTSISKEYAETVNGTDCITDEIIKDIFLEWFSESKIQINTKEPITVGDKSCYLSLTIMSPQGFHSEAYDISFTISFS